MSGLQDMLQVPEIHVVDRIHDLDPDEVQVATDCPRHINNTIYVCNASQHQT